jgi:hypothetical protein
MTFSSLEWSGAVLAITTIFTIAMGHSLVRKVNYHFGIKPAIPLFAVGIAIFIISLFLESNLFSGVCGIIGITTMIDGYEVIRQEQRIIEGRAKENPKRPVKKVKS